MSICGMPVNLRVFWGHADNGCRAEATASSQQKLQHNKPSPGVETIGEVMRIIYLLGLIAGIFLTSFVAQCLWRSRFSMP